MEVKSPKLLLFKMTILTCKAFMKKYKLKNIAMNESDSQKK